MKAMRTSKEDVLAALKTGSKLEIKEVRGQFCAEQQWHVIECFTNLPSYKLITPARFFLFLKNPRRHTGVKLA